MYMRIMTGIQCYNNNITINVVISGLVASYWHASQNELVLLLN